MISGQSALCHNFLASTLDQRCPATGGCVGLVVVRINKHLWCVLYHWVKADPGAPHPPSPPLSICPRTSFPAPEEAGGSDLEFPDARQPKTRLTCRQPASSLLYLG